MEESKLKANHSRRHSITKSIFKNRLKKSFWLILTTILGWCILLIILMNKIFMSMNGVSILNKYIDLILDNFIFRIVLLVLLFFIFYDLALAIGKAKVMQPWGRFIKHLNLVDSKKGEKFILRKGDVEFIPIVLAFNQMINRITHQNKKTKSTVNKLIQIIESNKINLTEEEKKIILDTKKHYEEISG